MSDETINWKYSKCLYCKKDVDPHHDCQVVKQCKKEGMRYCFHRSCMRKPEKTQKKIKKMYIFSSREFPTI